MIYSVLTVTLLAENFVPLFTHLNFLYAYASSWTCNGNEMYSYTIGVHTKTWTNPNRPEPTQIDPNQPKPTQTNPNRPMNRTGLTQTDLNRPEPTQNRFESTRIDPGPT